MALKELLDKEATEEELAEARELDETWIEALEAGIDSGTSKLGAIAGDKIKEVGINNNKPSDEIARTVFKASLKNNIKRSDIYRANKTENNLILKIKLN